METQAKTDAVRSGIDWVSLNNFSSIPILNVGYVGTAIVPLTGVFLTFLNHMISEAVRLQSSTKFPKGPFAEFLIILGGAHGSLGLGQSLIVLYIGAFSLAVGKLFYSVRCPKRIKRYGSYSSYIASLSNIAVSLDAIAGQRIRIAAYAANKELDDRLAERPKTDDEEEINQEILDGAKKIITESVGEGAREDYNNQVKSLLSNPRQAWNDANFDRFWSRLLIVACYTVSGVASAYMFFILAPANVCAATRFASRCQSFLHSLSEKMSYISDYLPNLFIGQG